MPKKKTKTVGAFLLLGVLMWAMSAEAQGGYTGEGILRGENGTKVIIWRSESSMKAGEVLFKANQIDIAVKYVACIVDSNTRVVVIPGGYDSFRVTVIDGPYRGCEGNVEKVYGGR